MNQAQAIIKKLGGPTVVAKVVGRHRTRVSGWQRSRIPQNHIPALLRLAKATGVELSADDFLSVEAAE
jgi:hypothetical protein